MNKDFLYHAISNKYLSPTRRPRTKCVGIELEFPLVNLRRDAVDFETVHRVTRRFVTGFGFSKVMTDDEGQIYNASDPQNGDTLSFDCSYNTLELSFGRENDLNVLYQRYLAYFTFLQSALQREEHMLTGMGINPYRRYNRRIPIPNERYRMLLHHLSSYQKYPGHTFHAFPDFGLFSCASQVQLDVEEDQIISVLQTFSKLEPLKSLLFANSPLETEDGLLLCSRDYLWKNSLHGLNPRNVDGYEPLPKTTDELVDYISGMSIYCVDRDGATIHFEPTPLANYFSTERINGEYWDGERFAPVCFTPEIGDLQYLRSFKFEDLTYRGTVEFRSVCEQPAAESMVCAAFHAGVMESIDEVNALLSLYRTPDVTQPIWRERFNRNETPTGLDRSVLSRALTDVLNCARAGLKKRGFGEEHFLDPLYVRAERLHNPAQVMLSGICSGKTLEDFIEAYAQLSFRR